jgi:hypothetical protein
VRLTAEFVYRYGQYFASGAFWLSFADPAIIPARWSLAGVPGRGRGGASTARQFAGEEVCALDLDDVELGEPSGKVLVRSGEREKYRGVPLT